MLRIGVLVSGGGTNLQAIIDKIECGYLKNCSIVTVVSSRPGAYALERAARHNIPSVCIPRKEYSEIEEYDKALIEHLKSYEVDLVVMAGFLSILGETFIRQYENRIINVHPSLIPAFCGKGYYGLIPHIKALEYGVKVTGRQSILWIWRRIPEPLYCKRLFMSGKTIHRSLSSAGSWKRPNGRYFRRR